MGDGIGGDIAAGAGAVLDDEGLTPSSSAIFLPTMRASTSLGPPGVNATTSVTGRLG